MQKVSLALNIVLIIAVSVLFYLFFSQGVPGKKKASKKSNKEAAVLPSNVKIAYVDLDSLETKYEYFTTKKTEFESRAASIQATLESKQKALEKDYLSAQERASVMTQSELEATQMRLQQKQQEIMQMEKDMGTRIEEDQIKFQEEYQTRVEEFLAQLNEEKKYTFVLSYRRIAGMVLYKDPAYDITAEVIDGLNEEYKKATEKPAAGK